MENTRRKRLREVLERREAKRRRTMIELWKQEERTSDAPFEQLDVQNLNHVNYHMSAIKVPRHLAVVTNRMAKMLALPDELTPNTMILEEMFGAMEEDFMYDVMHNVYLATVMYAARYGLEISNVPMFYFRFYESLLAYKGVYERDGRDALIELIKGGQYIRVLAPETKTVLEPVPGNMNILERRRVPTLSYVMNNDRDCFDQILSWLDEPGKEKLGKAVAEIGHFDGLSDVYKNFRSVKVDDMIKFGQTKTYCCRTNKDHDERRFISSESILLTVRYPGNTYLDITFSTYGLEFDKIPVCDDCVFYARRDNYDNFIRQYMFSED